MYPDKALTDFIFELKLLSTVIDESAIFVPES